MNAETHHPFGRTGLMMPKVVFGATVLGNLFVALRDEQKHELIAEWFRQVPKPVAIDSAGKYGAGLSLEVIHRELAALGVDPDDVVISNKLAWRRIPLTTPEPTFEPGVWIDLDRDAVQDISYDGIIRCHENGCEILGPYKPKLVSIHDPDEYLDAAVDQDDRARRLDDILGAYRALTELRDAGEFRGIGVGAKDWRTVRELDQYCDFDWVMMANSLTIMNHPPELIAVVDSLADQGVAIINSAVTHGGFLTGGKFLDYRPIDPSDRADAERLAWREKYAAVCGRHDRSPYEVAVAFGASHPGFASIALSTSSPGRVASMVNAAGAKMPAELWDDLRSAGLIAPDYQYV